MLFFNERIILGKNVLKEPLVKKQLETNLSQAVFSGNLVQVEDLAWEILKSNPHIFQKKDFLAPLRFSSRIDALEQLASHLLFKKKAPLLKQYFRNRKVVQKYARLLTRVDEQVCVFSEIEVLSEYFQSEKQNPETAFLLSLMQSLWQSGQLQPWSKAAWLRSFVLLEEEKLKELQFPFSKIQIIESDEKTDLALEKAFFERLKNCGIEIEQIKQNSNIADQKTEVFYHHSSYDQRYWILDQIQDHLEKGREVGLFISASNSEEVVLLYQMLLQRGMNAVFSPRLKSMLWKSNGEAVFWSSLLAVLSQPTGFEVKEIKYFFPKSIAALEVLEKAYQFQINRGAKKLKWLAAKLEGKPKEILNFFLDFFEILAIAQKPIERLESFLGFHNKYADLLKQELGIVEPQDSIWISFLTHLSFEREFLTDKKIKARFLKQAFDEWVPDSVKHPKIASNFWVFCEEDFFSEKLDSLFILSFNALEKTKSESSLEDLPIDLALAKVHSTPLPVNNELHFLSQPNIIFSGIKFDSSGSVLPLVSHPELLNFKPIKDQKENLVFEVHEQVGWNTEREELSTLKIEQGYVLPERLSISAFEDYLKCPYLFYSRHVAKAKREEELSLEPSPLTLGTLMHVVLADFMGLAILEKELPSLDRLFLFLEKRFSETPKKGLFRSPLLERQFYFELKARLGKWYEWEVEYQKKYPQVKPLAVEHAFEMHLTSDFTLTGRIDRIDSTDSTISVIDYKTGEGPFRGKELLEGNGIQLFAYAAYAAKRWGKEPGALFYLSLTRKPNSAAGVFLKKYQKISHTTHPNNKGLVNADFETLFHAAEEHWLAKFSELKAGKFTPKPYNSGKICQSCDYQKICGFKEVVENE